MHDNTIAHDALGARVQDSGWDQVELEFLAIDDNGVSCVGAAGNTGTDTVLPRQDINKFALTLITPLGAEHNVDDTLAVLMGIEGLFDALQ
jgi:hypothetical protein